MKTPDSIAGRADGSRAEGQFYPDKPAPSLRGRLIGLLLAAVAVIAGLQALVTWRTALSETEAVFDGQMERIALSLTGGLAASLLGDDALASGRVARDLIVQVWRADGVMLYRSPSDQLLPPQAVIGFTNIRVGHADFRVYALRTPTQVIQIAQDTATRRQAAGQLALRAVLPIALLAPLLMLIVWGVVTRALAPLDRVRRQLAERRASDLAPIGTAGVPLEVRPLIDELNALLARLAKAWDTLTHFTADAAHELRTPLAALRLQVQGLQRAPDAASRDVAADRLLSGIDRATRLVEQLLALARQEGATPDDAVELDLTELARAAVQDVASAAAARDVRMHLVAPTPVRLQGQPAALAVLLRNLLDNAIRHTPEGGIVQVQTLTGADAAPDRVVLTVEDAGAGVPPAERERVQDRFYRAPGTPGHGSGLGLAIVKSVADQHGARLRLDDSPTLGGLRVTLAW
ncbi:two-component sensor histidine kinase [Ottowia sp. GY511]|uniref:histidine kinase n=1 Tax=Ottowia flava TaxID=2675430 RepID=A0ABW4KU28_9BURK|nr:ATP-binding protein [Ottowia sp. GY511]TXK23363.1 two-component sensor histidine kinase [Ottowia sp. GY511]